MFPAARVARAGLDALEHAATHGQPTHANRRASAQIAAGYFPPPMQVSTFVGVQMSRPV